MGKDAIGYRAARKFGLGFSDVEKSIGITGLCSVDPATLSPRERRNPNEAAALEKRPVALMKWSFDDFIVEEMLPEGLVSGSLQCSTVSAPSPTQRSLLVPLLSEGVPDPAVEDLLANRCLVGVSFHFLTPVDYGSCSVRHVWIRGDSASLRKTFSTNQLLRTASGEVHLLPGMVCNVPSNASSFPLKWLPDLRYTIVLRNLNGSLSDVLPRIQHLSEQGFLNYSHMARHGIGSLRAYEEAKCILQREYPTFLQRYVKNLTEGSDAVQREMPFILELLGNPRSTSRDWKNALQGLEHALAHDKELFKLRQTGLYLPHLELLRDFTTRAVDVAPRHHDSAQVIRETISRAVLHEKMRAVSEIHFNSLASLRWRMFGKKVVVGDLVCRSPTSRGDMFEGAADHINGAMLSSAHVDWTETAEAHELSEFHDSIRIVATQAEADACCIDHVVLPYWGRGSGDQVPSQILPTHSCGEMFTVMARELRIEGLPAMRTASLGSYRHLLRKPSAFGAYIFDHQRGWGWVEGGAAGAALKERLYQDQDGVHRVRSPLMEANGRNMIARGGIRGVASRGQLLKPARKSGMTCLLQFRMPRGSPVTSALREVVQCTTLSPSGVYRLVTTL